MWEKHSQALAVFDDGRPRVMCPCVFRLHILNPHAAPLFWGSSLLFFIFGSVGYTPLCSLLSFGILDPHLLPALFRFPVRTNGRNGHHLLYSRTSNHTIDGEYDWTGEGS